MRVLFALLFSLSAICQTSPVDDPVYPQFEFGQLAPFQVGKLVSDIPVQFKPVEINLKNALKINRYELSHLGYKFPIFVQFAETIILDLFVRLPSYLLHDFFINLLLIITECSKNISSKIRLRFTLWTTNEVKRVYSGGCTISCFPIFYTEINNSENRPADYRSLYQLLNESLVMD